MLPAKNSLSAIQGSTILSGNSCIDVEPPRQCSCKYEEIIGSLQKIVESREGCCYAEILRELVQSQKDFHCAMKESLNTRLGELVEELRGEVALLKQQRIEYEEKVLKAPQDDAVGWRGGAKLHAGNSTEDIDGSKRSAEEPTIRNPSIKDIPYAAPALPSARLSTTAASFITQRSWAPSNHSGSLDSSKHSSKHSSSTINANGGCPPNKSVGNYFHAVTVLPDNGSAEDMPAPHHNMSTGTVGFDQLSRRWKGNGLGRTISVAASRTIERMRSTRRLESNGMESTSRTRL